MIPPSASYIYIHTYIQAYMYTLVIYLYISLNIPASNAPPSLQRSWYLRSSVDPAKSTDFWNSWSSVYYTDTQNICSGMSALQCTGGLTPLHTNINLPPLPPLVFLPAQSWLYLPFLSRCRGYRQWCRPELTLADRVEYRPYPRLEIAPRIRPKINQALRIYSANPWYRWVRCRPNKTRGRQKGAQQPRTTTTKRTTKKTKRRASTWRQTMYPVTATTMATATKTLTAKAWTVMRKGTGKTRSCHCSSC